MTVHHRLTVHSIPDTLQIRDTNGKTLIPDLEVKLHVGFDSHGPALVHVECGDGDIYESTPGHAARAIWEAAVEAAGETRVLIQCEQRQRQDAA